MSRPHFGLSLGNLTFAGKIAGHVGHHLKAGMDGMIYSVAGAEKLEPISQLGAALKLL